jgi:glycosyltransferase involved in cell wall biosynthesis
MSKPVDFRPVGLVPAYEARSTVGDVVRGVLRLIDRVVVVDDGSRDDTGAVARGAGADVLRLPQNSGKGAALRAGLEAILAPADGATHVAFLDSDGQHDPSDLAALLAAAQAGEDFVIGSRMSDPDAIPTYRFRTNEIGSRILTRMTGHEIEDGQSGFRVVAASVLRQLRLNARGYSIENEMILKSAPHVRRFAHVPVRAIYGGPSHYRPFRDTWVISWASVYYKVFELD